ncbi:MAG: stage II sporulation protein D [Clostridium sp.]|nr:stage II sporulation protein D [Clostridium sp.]MCM1444156.1 stage II sporulation protein D [Candidatus Amulumruptor caecigallinarius]
MISGYKIINQNGEDVLFLYLDYNYEFSKDFKSDGIFKNIKSFIKSINFTGKKVLVVVSGIIISTLLINPIKLQNSVLTPNPYNYVSKIIIHDFTEKNLTDYEIIIDDTNDISKKQEVESIKEEKPASEKNSSTTNNKTSNKESQNKNTSSSQNKNQSTTKKNTSSSNNTSSTNKNTQTHQNNTTNNVSKETSSTTQNKVTNEKNNAQMVTVYRNNGTILNIELEEYIIGVVGAEMPASFNIEALKAQAIVARTYALKSIQDGKKLTDTVSTQAYKDNKQLQAVWGSDYSKYYSKIKSAVESTKGKVVLYNNSYIEAYYHSTSNGYTENSSEVWGKSLPYLKSVESSWDKKVNSYKKTVKFSIDEFTNLLGLDIEEPITYEIIHNDSGRVRNIIINNKSFTGVKFREILKLRSADFEVSLNDDNVEITTYGYGHGVGMSQYGANEMAKLGYNYSQIIKHYYSGVTIK